MSENLPERSRLAQLADEIRAEVDAAEAQFQSAVQHAIKAGEKLIEAKALVRHGEWGSWLEASFPGSERTAQLYMQLARNPQRVADLPSVRDAVALLAASKGQQEPDSPDDGPVSPGSEEVVYPIDRASPEERQEIRGAVVRRVGPVARNVVVRTQESEEEIPAEPAPTPKTKAKTPEVGKHSRTWNVIETHLDKIEHALRNSLRLVREVGDALDDEERDLIVEHLTEQRDRLDDLIVALSQGR